MSDPDLEAAAEEELRHAAGITWRELSRVMPWGDTYEGFTPGGRDVCFERSYLWDGPPGSDIRVEVTVYEQNDYEGGVRLTASIARTPA